MGFSWGISHSATQGSQPLPWRNANKEARPQKHLRALPPVPAFAGKASQPPEPSNPQGNTLQHRLEKAVEAAREAGKILMRHFQSTTLEISRKAGNEIVTNADPEADEAIQSVLKQAFPQDDFLTEETFDPARAINMKSAWIIDPLDATRNFANGIPHFAVSIAYIQDKKPMVGVVFDPTTQELFTAIAGDSAKLNGQPLTVNSATSHKDTILSLCNPLPPSLAQEKLSHRRLGCSALDLAYVASGRLGAACERNLKVWDIAAGIPMVEAAGGKVTDFNGQPIDLGQQGKVNFLATNTLLHPTMLEHLKEKAPSSEPKPATDT
jgi:myo-inositol-1(or 4)-monophosphatase